jgi:hypothetical protein
MEEYRRLYRESIEQRNEFWRRRAERLEWIEPAERIYEFDPEAIKISWAYPGV